MRRTYASSASIQRISLRIESKRQKNRRKRTAQMNRNKALIALVIAAVGLGLLMKLKHPVLITNNELPVTRTEQDMRYVLMVAHRPKSDERTMAVAQMVLSGKLLTLSSHTPIEAYGPSDGVVEIKVTEGPMTGENLWASEAALESLTGKQ
jgi:hypothetical protein